MPYIRLLIDIIDKPSPIYAKPNSDKSGKKREKIEDENGKTMIVEKLEKPVAGVENEMRAIGWF